MRNRALCLVLAISAALAGCSTTTVSTGAAVIGEPLELEDTSWILVWGLIGDNVNVPADRGAARVRVHLGPGGWLVSVLTVGLVAPWTVEVWPIAVERGGGWSQDQDLERRERQRRQDDLDARDRADRERERDDRDRR